MSTDTVAQKVIKRYGTLKAQRINWESHWDEVAKYVIPRKDNVYGQATPGEKRANRLFDSSAIRANDDLASNLHGMLTNPATVWFGLSTGDKELDKKPEVLKWLHRSTLQMIQTLNNSNFQTEKEKAASKALTDSSKGSREKNIKSRSEFS